jgi:hypothetical protein
MVDLNTLSALLLKTQGQIRAWLHSPTGTGSQAVLIILEESRESASTVSERSE